ncbi:MAG: hypothetical protein M1282_03725 [Chloroflexi bacterium]|nr:hypothetical protein [Chloroflexota bacterium]
MKRLFSVLFLLGILLSACAPAPAPVANQPKTPQALQPTVVSAALFQIVKPDGTKVGVTMDDMKKLPLAQLTVEGKVEEGPKLLDILNAAGVTDFTELTLTGSSSPATLTRAQVDDNTLLDFTNHGTVKLATTYIPKANWTKDISEITVK